MMMCRSLFCLSALYLYTSLTQPSWTCTETSIYPYSSTTVRNMDKSGRGFLSNETVYKLMQEQLQMQKSLFQMKKIIVGWVHERDISCVHISLCISYVIMRIISFIYVMHIISYVMHIIYTYLYVHIYTHITSSSISILHNTLDFSSSSSSSLYPISVRPSPLPYSPRIRPRTPRADHLN